MRAFLFALSAACDVGRFLPQTARRGYLRDARAHVSHVALNLARPGVLLNMVAVVEEGWVGGGKNQCAGGMSTKEFDTCRTHSFPPRFQAQRVALRDSAALSGCAPGNRKRTEPYTHQRSHCARRARLCN